MQNRWEIQNVQDWAAIWWWPWTRSVHNIISSQFILEHLCLNSLLISCFTLNSAFSLMYKCSLLELYSKFFLFSNWHQWHILEPPWTCLPCSEAAFPSLQSFRPVAYLDFEIIELKQQFCGSTHRQTDRHVQTVYVHVTLCPLWWVRVNYRRLDIVSVVIIN